MITTARILSYFFLIACYGSSLAFAIHKPKIISSSLLLTTATAVQVSSSSTTPSNTTTTTTTIKTNSKISNTDTTYERPLFVRNILDEYYNNTALNNNNNNNNNNDALNNDTNYNNNDNNIQEKYIYYFGLGSNMLRSKIENRGINNSKINIIEMEPAIVKGYRLSFNMKGFPPLEPAMGSLEPVDSDSKAIFLYDEPECHGALVKLTPENYDKLMRSEGISPNNTNPGYEEIIITAIPYNTTKLSVQAVALRARKHVRLIQDGYPSKRYMNILKEGAAELNLKLCYQNYLNNHPIQYIPNWLKYISINNLIFTITLSSVIKTRIISKIQSFLIFFIYNRLNNYNNIKIIQQLNVICMGIILLPGSILGMIIRIYLKIFNKELSPMLQRFISMVDEKKE